MASRTASRALRSSLRQAAKAPAVQQRTFVSAVNAASRPALAQAPKAATSFVQQRGVKTIDFAGHKEDVYGMHNHEEHSVETQWLTARDRARRLAP
jgi:ketol-acid reductoisomerase